MRVIGYEEQYKKAVYEICLATAGNVKKEKDKEFLMNMYCSNYIENEIAFVLLDDTDKPAGYILCAADFEKYCEHMKPYLDRIRHLGFVKKMMARSEILGYKAYAKTYPAHLHVDILEECTGKGGGRLLMNTLLTYLKEQKVPGVMLQVAADNQRAIGYYKSMGFEVLSENSHVLALGHKLW